MDFTAVFDTVSGLGYDDSLPHLVPPCMLPNHGRSKGENSTYAIIRAILASTSMSRIVASQCWQRCINADHKELPVAEKSDFVRVPTVTYSRMAYRRKALALLPYSRCGFLSPIFFTRHISRVLNSHIVRVIGLCLMLVAGLSACRLADTTQMPEFSDVAQVTATDVPGNSLVVEESAADPDRQLVIWAPDFLATGELSSAQQILSDASAQFMQANPGAKVEILPKTQNGPAAILPYLRGAQQAAPAILPDVVMLSSDQLWQAADLGLVQPLDEDVVNELGDFFPFAIQASSYNGQLYSVPYAVQMTHVVSDLGYPSPASWDDLLASDDVYLFQGASTENNLNSSLIAHYVAAGAELGESVAASPVVLQRLLQFYSDGRASDVIPSENTTLTDLGAVWRAYADHAGTIADSDSAFLLGQRDVLGTVSFQSVPTYDGNPAALATVWVFAVLTDDAVRHTEALEFIQTLLEPSVQGTWSQFVSFMPSTRSALETWDMTQPYNRFLKELSEENVAVIPPGHIFRDFAHRLQEAQQGVMSGEKTVDEALVDLTLAP